MGGRRKGTAADKRGKAPPQSKSRKESRKVTGKLVCHPEGYGFVVPDDLEDGPDVFIPPRRMGAAADGDRVEVQLIPGGRRGRGKDSRVGEVTTVVSRGRVTVVGRVLRFRNEVLAAPLDPRYYYSIRLVDDEAADLAEGTVVAVRVIGQPSEREPPWGEVEEVLGDISDPDIRYRIVCHELGIPTLFPEAVGEEAVGLSFPTGKDLNRRTDFRDLPTVTIDGETARDFDDAVGMEKLENGGFRLYVHVADVSHYVREATPLDREAFRRGTSVYFPDRAVPMLPPELSSDLCSLRPGEDRLTLSVVIDLDRRGVRRKARIHESVIRSDARLTYTLVEKILKGDREEEVRHASLVHLLQWMQELARILNSRRRERGAIDLDIPEAEVLQDDSGEVRDVVRAKRLESHRIIEEFMLLANETVAATLEEARLPSLFRVHEPPDPEKVEDFLEVAAGLGFGMERSATGAPRSGDFQKLAERLQGKPEERFLSFLMLRSFAQARYSDHNEGHFALASEAYTHFTSPIRRYPDLVVHRILKRRSAGAADEEWKEALEEHLPEIARHSSSTERRADEAERRIVRWLMARFMEKHLGDEYEATVTGVRHNGFFVELEEHFVEGFVPVETLHDDFYVLNPRHHCLIGENSRRVFRIGDRVRVRVDKVNTHRSLIDFSAVLPEPPPKKGRRR